MVIKSRALCSGVRFYPKAPKKTGESWYIVTAQPTAFFHEDGIVPAWNLAKKYAGPEGRIATLPGIIAARLASRADDLPWNRYFTTATAEYYGIGADGREKLIVAHGVGPLSTLAGVTAAYAWEYEDKSRSRRGGRISAEEFLKLEAGEYGHVTTLHSVTQFLRLNGDLWHYPIFVIDFDNYVQSAGEYPFLRRENFVDAQLDLLLLARLGVYALNYILVHHAYTRAWLAERRVPERQMRNHPYIIFNEGATNCPYTIYPRDEDSRYWLAPISRPLEEDKAMAHLIVISGLMNMGSSDDQGSWTSLVAVVECHKWSDNVRFLAVPGGADWDAGIAEMG